MTSDAARDEMPGDQNVIGATDMCLDPMGMVWLKDFTARKPRPHEYHPGDRGVWTMTYSSSSS